MKSSEKFCRQTSLRHNVLIEGVDFVTQQRPLRGKERVNNKPTCYSFSEDDQRTVVQSTKQEMNLTYLLNYSYAGYMQIGVKYFVDVFLTTH